MDFFEANLVLAGYLHPKLRKKLRIKGVQTDTESSAPFLQEARRW